MHRVFYRLIPLLSLLFFSVLHHSHAQIVDAGPDQDTCSTTQMEATNPGLGYTGTWSVVSGNANFNNPNAPNTTVTGLDPGTNELQWEVNGTTDNVIINNTTPLVSAGADETVCNNSYQLGASEPDPGESGVWSIENGQGTVSPINDPSATITNLSGEDPTTLEWRVTSPVGCEAYDHVTVKYDSLSAVAGDDRTVCTSSTTLNADPPFKGTGQWYTNGTATIANPGSTNSGVSDLVLGVNKFIWRVEKGACAVEDTVTLTNKKVSTPYAGEDQTVCAYTDTLDASVANVNETGTWSVSTGSANFSDPHNPKAEASDLAYGVNNLVWTITNGTCSRSDEVNIINDLPYVVDAGEDQTICQDTTHLAATPLSRGSGTWTAIGSSPGLIDDATKFNTAVTNLTDGNENSETRNTFVWTATHAGCVVRDTVVILAEGYDLSSDYAASAPADNTLCADTFDLSSIEPDNTGSSGEWSVIQGNAAFDDPSTFSTIARNLEQGTNTLRWTTTVTTYPKECIFNSDVELINDLPNPAVAGADQTTCDNETDLNAQQPQIGTGEWTVVETGNHQFADKNDRNTHVSKLNKNINTFVWTVTHNECALTDTLLVYTPWITNADAGADQSVCNASVDLQGSTPEAGQTGVWTNISANSATFNDASEYNTAVALNDQFYGAGYTFEWRLSNNEGCSDADTVAMEYFGDVNADAMDDTTICKNYLTLNATPVSAPKTGKWILESGAVTFADNTDPDTEITNIQQGENTLIWQVNEPNNGCRNNDTVYVTNRELTAVASAYESVVCSDNVQLNSPPLNSGQTGQWTATPAAVTFVDPTIPDTKALNLQNGLNKLTWSLSNGACSSDSTISVTYNQVISDAGKDTTVCSSSASLVADNTPPEGLWSPLDNSATIANPTYYTSNVSQLKYGLNTFEWKINNGKCSDADQVEITNDLHPDFTAGEDLTVCQNNDTTLNAYDPVDPAGTGTWSSILGGGNVLNANTYNTTVTQLQPDTNIFRWTVTEKSCSGITDDVKVVNNTPTQAEAGPDETICKSSYRFAATEPEQGTGQWIYIGNDNPAPTFDDENAYNTKVHNLTPRSAGGDNRFVWQISKGQCVSRDTIEITFIHITANAGKDTTICNSSYALKAQEPNEGIGEWSVDYSDGSPVFATPTYQKTTVSNLGSNNNLIWKVQEDICIDRDTVFIKSQRFEANAGADETVCGPAYDGLSAALDEGQQTGIWSATSTGNGVFNNPTLFNSEVYDMEPGKNIFTWTVTNASGCTDSDSITILNKKYAPITASASASTVCGTSVNVQGSATEAPWQAKWVSSTATFAAPASRNTTAGSLDYGANTLSWRVTRGSCKDSATVTVHNSGFIASAANQTVCSNNTTLEGKAVVAGNNETITDACNWAWSLGASGDGTFTSPTNQATVTVENLSTGINKFDWTAEKDGCQYSGTMQVVFNKVTANAGLDDTTCLNSYQLRAEEPLRGSGQWTVEQGLSNPFADPTSNDTEVALDRGDNQFKWEVTSGKCSAEDYVEIVSNNTNEAVAEAVETVVCSTTATLAGNTPVSGASGLWTTPGNAQISNPTQPGSDVSDLKEGANIFTWTITKGECKDDSSVVIYNESLTANAGEDMTVCADQAQLDATEESDYNGRWSSVTNGSYVFDNSNSSKTTVRNLEPNDNVFRWTINNGYCNDYEDVVVTNNGFDANPGADETICSDTYELQALGVGSGSGEWKVISGDGILDDPSAISTTVRELSKGPNTIRWVAEKNNCQDSAEIVITNRSVTANPIEPAQAVCGPETELLASEPQDGSGLWTELYGGAQIQDPDSSRTTVTNLALGDNIFRWKVENAYCRDSARLTITNDSPGVVNAGANDTICETSYMLVASPPVEGSTGYWSTSSESAFILSPTSISTGVVDLATGTNSFIWTVNKNNCEAKDTVEIINNHYPVYAGADQTLCTSTAYMTATLPTPSSTGSWYLINGQGNLQNNNLPNSQVTNIGKGDNQFVWRVNTSGCTNRDTVTLQNNQIIAAAGKDTAVCNDYYQLQAEDPGENSGMWSIDGGYGEFDDQYTHNTFVRNMYQGINTFRWRVTGNGCENSSIVKVTNNSFDVEAGPDDEISDGSSYELNASLPNGAGGIWTTIGGNATIVSPYNPTTDVVNLSTGVNKFKFTAVMNGCETSDTVTVLVRNFDANAGPDQNLCVDTTRLQAMEPTAGASGQWSVVSGSANFANRTYWNTRVFDLQKNAENVLRWTVTKNGVSVYDEVSIFNNAFDIEAGEDIASCERTAILNAQPAGTNGTGQWSVASGSANIADNQQPDTEVSELGPGLNKLVWAVERNGCTSEDTVNVTYYKPPVASFTASVTESCSPYNVTFNNTSDSSGSASIEYFWEFGDGQANFVEDTTKTYTFSSPLAKDTTYQVMMVATSENGCQDTAYEDITVYPKPHIGFRLEDTVLIHPNTTVNIIHESQPGYDRYLWDYGDGNTELQESFQANVSYKYNPDHFLEGTRRITLTVDNGLCRDTVSHVVRAIPSAPVAKIDTFIEGCAPLTVDFNNHTRFADTYTWEFGNGATSTRKEPTYTFYEPGTYVVALEASGKGGTDYIRKDTVLVHKLPVAFFEVKPDSVMLPNQPMRGYNLSEDATSYLWDFGDGDTSREESPVHYYQQPGYFDIQLKVWSKHGCADSIRIADAIFVEEGGALKFPDAFTPNTNGPLDGHYSEGQYNNDIFFPLHRGIEKYELRIYNRWGELIFKTNDPDIGWDGYYDGKLMPQDTYIYKAEGYFRNGSPFTRAGSVTLLY